MATEKPVRHIRKGDWPVGWGGAARPLTHPPNSRHSKTHPPTHPLNHPPTQPPHPAHTRLSHPPMCPSIAATSSTSYCVMKDRDQPARPARAVRPTLWCKQGNRQVSRQQQTAADGSRRHQQTAAVESQAVWAQPSSRISLGVHSPHQGAVRT